MGTGMKDDFADNANLAGGISTKVSLRWSPPNLSDLTVLIIPGLRYRKDWLMFVER
jgi:hypothetical protein